MITCFLNPGVQPNKTPGKELVIQKMLLNNLVLIFGAIGLLFMTMFICMMMKIYCATVRNR